LISFIKSSRVQLPVMFTIFASFLEEEEQKEGRSKVGKEKKEEGIERFFDE
jgi:hypothetical protein